jgi:hypothetical protein
MSKKPKKDKTESPKIVPGEPTGDALVDWQRMVSGFLPGDGGYQPAPIMRWMDRAFLAVSLGRPRKVTEMYKLGVVDPPGEGVRKYNRVFHATLVHRIAEGEDFYADGVSFNGDDVTDLPTPVRDAALVYIAAVAAWDEMSDSGDEGTVKINPKMKPAPALSEIRTPTGYLKEMLAQTCYSDGPRRFAQDVLEGLIRREDLPARMRDVLEAPSKSNPMTRLQIIKLLAAEPELADNHAELARRTGLNRNTFARSRTWRAILDRVKAQRELGASAHDKQQKLGKGRRVLRSKPPEEK